jgi:hypothetical protein
MHQSILPWFSVTNCKTPHNRNGLSAWKDHTLLSLSQRNKLKITILRAAATKPHSNPGPNSTHTGFWPTVYFLLEFYLLVSCVCSFYLLAWTFLVCLLILGMSSVFKVRWLLPFGCFSLLVALWFHCEGWFAFCFVSLLVSLIVSVVLVFVLMVGSWAVLG